MQNNYPLTRPVSDLEHGELKIARYGRNGDIVKIEQGECEIATISGMPSTHPAVLENAHFIVYACNAHKVLITDMQMLLAENAKLLEALEAIMGKEGFANFTETNWQNAKAAIAAAKAEGVREGMLKAAAMVRPMDICDCLDCARAETYAAEIEAAAGEPCPASPPFSAYAQSR